MQSLLVGPFLLCLVSHLVNAYPTEAGRQPVTQESANLIITNLEKNGITLDDDFVKRSSVINADKRGYLDDWSINVLIENIIYNEINFDIGRLQSRPLSDNTINDILAAMETAGIRVDLNILGKRDIQVNSLTAGAESADTFPDCSQDPARVIPYTGAYKIGQGVKIDKKDSNGVDACDTKGSTVWCWTEQWLVETEIEYTAWIPTGLSTDYAKNTSNSSTLTWNGEACITHKSGKERGFEINLQNKFEFATKRNPGWTMTTKPHYSYRSNSNTTDTTCTLEGNQATCAWTDQQCHSMWFSQRNERIYGYLQRTCASDVPASVQQLKGTVDKSGNTVLGIMDYNFLLPVGGMIGCGASCEDQVYPSPIPMVQNTRIPFVFN